MQSNPEFEFDQNGGPVLQTNIGQQVANVGISARNVLTTDAPPQLQALLTARLQSELQRSSLGKVSDHQIRRDLQLLQRALEQDVPLETSLPSQSLESVSESPSSERIAGNLPQYFTKASWTQPASRVVITSLELDVQYFFSIRKP